MYSYEHLYDNVKFVASSKKVNDPQELQVG